MNIWNIHILINMNDQNMLIYNYIGVQKFV